MLLLGLLSREGTHIAHVLRAALSMLTIVATRPRPLLLSSQNSAGACPHRPGVLRSVTIQPCAVCPCLPPCCNRVACAGRGRAAVSLSHRSGCHVLCALDVLHGSLVSGASMPLAWQCRCASGPGRLVPPFHAAPDKACRPRVSNDIHDLANERIPVRAHGRQ